MANFERIVPKQIKKEVVNKKDLKAEEEKAPSTGMEIVISGTYLSDRGVQVDYNGMVKKIPYCPDREYREYIIRQRYVPMWLAKDQKFVAQFKQNVRCFVDSEKNCEYIPSFVGKDIRKMTEAEIQELAYIKNLIEVPIFRSLDIEDLRMKAYLKYSEVFLGEAPTIVVKGKNKEKHIYEFGDREFSLEKLPAIVVKDSIFYKRYYYNGFESSSEAYEYEREHGKEETEFLAVKGGSNRIQSKEGMYIAT